MNQGQPMRPARISKSPYDTEKSHNKLIVSVTTPEYKEPNNKFQNIPQQIDNEFIEETPELPGQQEDNQPKQQEERQALKEGKHSQASKQAKQESEVNGQVNKLTAIIQKLRQDYQDLDIQQIMLRKRNPKKQAQIKNFLNKLSKEKSNLMKKVKRFQDKQRQRKQEIELIKEKERQIQHERKIAQIRKYMVDAQEKGVEGKKVQKEKEKIVEEFYAKRKNQKRVYKVMELEEKKKRGDKIELDRGYLDRRKKNYGPVDADELSQHEKNYEKVRLSLQELKHRERVENLQEVKQGNQKLVGIWRGRAYEKAQKEMEGFKKGKVISNQRGNKIKKYQEHIRQNFAPQQPEEDSEEEAALTEEQQRALDEERGYRQVKKQRYLHGVSCGEIIQKIPIPKDITQQRKLGNDYLDYLRSLPKKPQTEGKGTKGNKSDEHISTKGKINQTAHKLQIPVPKHRSRSVVLADGSRKEDIQYLLVNLKSKDEQLKMKQRYMNRHRKVQLVNEVDAEQRDLNDSIIDNIERKLSLLKQI